MNLPTRAPAGKVSHLTPNLPLRKPGHLRWNQFPLWQRLREEFKDPFSAFYRKVAPEADSVETLLGRNPAPTASTLKNLIHRKPQEAGGSGVRGERTGPTKHFAGGPEPTEHPINAVLFLTLGTSRSNDHLDHLVNNSLRRILFTLNASCSYCVILKPIPRAARDSL